MPERHAADARSQLRPMMPADVPAVMAVQTACYGPDLLEPEPVLHTRLRAAAGTCWVAVRDGRVCAYLAAYRAQLGTVTPLHAPFRPAARPDTLYLHDLAVDPAAHGTGLGGRLVDTLVALGRGEGLRWTALVAVQGAQPFWERRGWARRDPAPAAHPRLRAYGDDACYMVRSLEGA